MATPKGERFDRAFFARFPAEVAFDLLGAILISDRPPARAAGRIVEVEAYAGPEDLASHAGKLRAGRAAMLGPPGMAYVYRSYGIHAMLNVVAHEELQAGAVLIRALEPCRGIPTMEQRRGKSSSLELCAGPGRLCQALAVRLTDNGLALDGNADVWIERGPAPKPVLCSERIGITQGKEATWRFFVGDNRFVSPPRRGVPCDDHSNLRLPESG